MDANEMAKELETAPSQECAIELSDEDLDEVGGGLAGLDGTHN